MEDKSSTLTPSLSDSKISYGMYGRAREEVETVSATMAPNVGLPYSTTEERRSDPPSRRDTGYVLHANLSTPDDFRSKSSGRLRPDFNVDPEIYFTVGDRSRAPKNVTFHGVRRGERQSRRSPSSSSTDSSGGESDVCFVTGSRRHSSGQYSGGARDPPINVAGLGDVYKRQLLWRLLPVTKHISDSPPDESADELEGDRRGCRSPRRTPRNVTFFGARLRSSTVK